MSVDIIERGPFGFRRGRLAKAGDSVDTHAHNFGHATFLYGAADVDQMEPVRWDGHVPAEFRVLRTIRRDRPGHVWIPAGMWHRITARVDNLEYECWYVSRTPDGKVSSEDFTGWPPSYE